MDENKQILIDAARKLSLTEVIRRLVFGEVKIDLTLRELVNILSKKAEKPFNK
jgi:hypothetical protein